MEIPVLGKLTADHPGKSDIKTAPGKWNPVLCKGGQRKALLLWSPCNVKKFIIYTNNIFTKILVFIYSALLLLIFYFLNS